IGQDLPGIPAFSLLGEPECQLPAVSQAGGYPSHQKQRGQRGESGWASPGKKQETGETARQSSGSVDPAQGGSQHREAQRHPGGDGQPFRGRCPAVCEKWVQHCWRQLSVIRKSVLGSQFSVLIPTALTENWELRNSLLTADLNDPPSITLYSVSGRGQLRQVVLGLWIRP